jgi:hypothetical protein
VPWYVGAVGTPRARSSRGGKGGSQKEETKTKGGSRTITTRGAHLCSDTCHVAASVKQCASFSVLPGGGGIKMVSRGDMKRVRATKTRIQSGPSGNGRTTERLHVAEAGGSENILLAGPPTTGKSVRFVCERHAVAGCEEGSKCESHA